MRVQRTKTQQALIATWKFLEKHCLGQGALQKKVYDACCAEERASLEGGRSVMSYREGYIWIAHNDEPGSRKVSDVKGFISVALLADLFGKTPEAVARQVVKYRKDFGV